MLLVARIIRLVTMGVVAVIVAAILFFVFEANPSNDIVSAITDWARWLVGPFKNLFNFDNAKTAVAVNWGLAALVYGFVGSLLASLCVRASAVGEGWRARRRRAAY